MLGPAMPKQQKMGDNENDDQAPGTAVATKAATLAARQRKEEEGDLVAQKGLRNIVAVIGSLVLSMAREQALIRSILVHVILYKASAADMHVGVKAATKAYSVEGAALSSEQKKDRGSPHLYAWNAMLMHQKALPAVDQHVKDIEKKAAQIVEAQVATWSTLSAPPKQDLLMKRARESALQEMVYVARCTSCWDPELVRMEICTKADSSAEAAARSIMQEALSKWGGGGGNAWGKRLAES